MLKESQKQESELGLIQELKMSDSNLRLSFLKDSSIPNLIFLASFDETSKSVNVQRFLRKISRTFLRKFNLNHIINWSGKSGQFDSFEEIVEEYAIEEEQESDKGFKEKVETLFKNIEEKFQTQEVYLKKMSSEILEQEKNLHEKKASQEPEYYQYIPYFKLTKKPEPRYYLTGKKSINVFDEIDGDKSIKQIAENLNLGPEEVFKISKNLVKLGFLSYN
jgi:hypothetical protein